jgi:beta-lactam-binding protein with PASTA domain
MSGDDDAPRAAPTTAATAAATVATSPTAAPTSAGEPTAKPTPSRTRSRAAAARVTVPDGVGQNYQTAQDLWRGAGLIVLPAEDASGEDRLMVLDANWVVLAQDPGAGSKVPAGSTIRATVKKYSD